jgi:hypothetical protein
MNIQWAICDGIAPFFKYCPEGTINWSKIPFADFESAWNIFGDAVWEELNHDFRVCCETARRLGFNVITLDDLAHLFIHTEYPKELKNKLSRYRQHYRKLFAIAKEYELEVWITSDIIFWNPTIQSHTSNHFIHLVDFFCCCTLQVLMDFPEIRGIILRFGESDGKDVQGDFKSKLIIRTVKQMRTLLQRLLPIFDERDCWCILRTWSVGVYPIGDMIWNPKTIDQCLKSLNLTRLILSLKYGESDFFRFLPLNHCFWIPKVFKIIELQARREYEGAGRFPSFIGFEYEIYRNELRSCDTLIGVMVWTQTGGWTNCKRLTFMEDTGLWNLLNTRVTLALFCSLESCEDILLKIQADFFPSLQPQQWIDFCRLSHHVIRRIFYIEDFALQKLFFRRVRIPPMLGITWDQIWQHPLLDNVMKLYIIDPSRWLSKSWEALIMVDEMIRILGQHPLQNDLLNLRDTSEIIVLHRQISFGQHDERYIERLNVLLKAPRTTESYRFKIARSRYNFKNSSLRYWIKLFIRDRSKYRILDQILTLRLMAYIFPFVYYFKRKNIPKELRDQAMGIESLFK